jgi:SAM-dependent methyltransferase
MPWEIFDAAAHGYERWYATPKGRRIDREERRLVDWLLLRIPSTERLLEVGCGTGHFSEWLRGRGHRVCGLDRSPGMLQATRARCPDAPVLLGEAERLAVRSRSVDVVLFVTSLEFLENPCQALEEAVRVTRHGLILLVLNRWSLGGLSRRIGPQARQPLLGQARDYSPASLRRLIAAAVGERLQTLHCRTGCFPRGCWPTPSRLPAGDIIGMAAILR